MNFSERNGYKDIRASLQIESIDEALENRLWNLILDTLIFKIGELSDSDIICKIIWAEYYGEKKDETPRWNPMVGSSFIHVFRAKYVSSEWYEKYDLLEYINGLDEKWMNLDFCEKCNYALKKEMSGYRLVEGKFLQTTDTNEILSIKEAIEDNKWKAAAEHFKASLDLLTNREKPDFRNSIKESISAVESVCCTISGNDKASLGDALKLVEEKHALHGALKSAFSSLYGYTSDESGIRHKLQEDGQPLLFEDAKFMLVVCSAFVNYLKIKTS
jgi:hypothetical protein